MIAAGNIAGPSRRARIVTTLAALTLALAAMALCTQMAWAAEDDWTVTFTGSSMTSDGTADINKTLSGLQPGDSATFNVKLFNDCDEQANWYMKNSVLKTMEDEFASGGSYTYRLTYTDPQGKESVIIGNESVSGEGDSAGLFDATNATGEWFFLDKLPANGKGEVSLYVALDPESHGNSYFDTTAELELSFAAQADGGELVTETPGAATTGDQGKESSGGFKLPSTGDMLKLGLLVAVAIAAFAVWGFVHRRSGARREGGK